MSDEIESYSIENGTLKIRVMYDSDPENPRSMDPWSSLRIKGSRYLGEVNEDPDTPIFIEDEDGDKKVNPEILCLLPVYAYIHGDVALSTGPFSCPWDSGQCGWIFVTEAKFKEENFLPPGSTREEMFKRAKELLEGDLETYGNWISGNVYGYEVQSIDVSTGCVIDENSCWGFNGDLQFCKQEAEAAARYLRRQLVLPGVMA